MLRFNDEQAAAIIAERRAFNQSQIALAANESIMGNAAPVDIDSWRRIDTRATLVQRDILAVFNRLAAASQTPIDVGDLVNYFPQISDSGEVTVSMDGRQTGRSDQALVKYAGTPIPVLGSEARWGWRQMAVNRKGRLNIDGETIANHQRRIAEKAEDMVLNGDAQVVVGGSTIYGLRNHPSRNTFSHTFTLNGATGANWLTTFSAMINALIGDNAFGKVTVFLNYGDYTYASLNEFAANYSKTILMRMKEIENVADIVPCSKLPASNIIGIAGLETGGWGTILSAMPMTVRPKARANPEDDYVFSVMMMAAPQFRVDYNGLMPVAHGVT
jgi:uncharacterized linocin/CFP29 family protein